MCITTVVNSSFNIPKEECSQDESVSSRFSRKALTDSYQPRVYHVDIRNKNEALHGQMSLEEQGRGHQSTCGGCLEAFKRVCFLAGRFYGLAEVLNNVKQYTPSVREEPAGGVTLDA